MSISVLLGLTVYLFLLAKRTPETSLAIPLISRFLMFAMVAVTCSIVSSGEYIEEHMVDIEHNELTFWTVVIVLNIHHKHTVSDSIPKWATYFIFQFLPRWIFIQGPVKLDKWVKPETGRRPSIQLEKTLSNSITMLQSTNTFRRTKGQMSHKKSSLLASLTGSAGHEVRAACSEITIIADFLTAREANRTNVSEWHILAAVLDRILLICFSITLLTGSYFFYSEIGRHPVPEHPFWSHPNDIIRRNTTEYEDYRGCNEYHAGAGLYFYLKCNFIFSISPNCNKNGTKMKLRVIM